MRGEIARELAAAAATKHECWLNKKRKIAI